MVKFVPEQLRKAADIYEQRNALYGDNYKWFGNVMAALFPNGAPARMAGVDGSKGETMAEYYNRVGVLVQIVSKLTRYCAQFERGGHADSLDDMAVYAMMLRELDQEAAKPRPSYCSVCETFGVNHRGLCDDKGSLSKSGST